MSCGKSTRFSFQWPSVVLSWVQLFDEETSNISTVKQTKFYEETIRTIFQLNGQEKISFRNNDDLGVKFIKEFYPEIIREKRFNTKNEDDILILLSLLMYTTCVKYKIESFVTKTCTIKLDDDHQEAVKRFFEMMLTVEDGNFTRRTIMDTIQQCFDPVEVASARKSLSPSTQRSSLKEFLGSPSLQNKYQKSKDENEIKHLNRILQEEVSELFMEKEILLVKSKGQETILKKLESNLNEKNQEISFLKQELLELSNRNPVSDDLNKIEKSLKKEMQQLQEELKEMQLENNNLLQLNEKYTQQKKGLEDALKETEVELMEKSKYIDKLQCNLETCEAKNLSLENSVKELRKTIEQFEEERSLMEELNMSFPRVEENLGIALKDIELQEKLGEINQLQEQLRSLQLTCQEKDLKYKTIENILIENDFTIKNLKKEVKQQAYTVSIMNQNCIELDEKLKEANCKNSEDVKLPEENIAIEKHRNLELVDAINEFKITEKKLQDDLLAKNLAMDKIEIELQLKCLEIKNLHDEFQSMSLHTEKLQNEYHEKCLEVESLKDELQLKCIKIGKLEFDFESKCKEIEKIQVELQCKCEDLENLKCELQSKCSELAKVQHELTYKCTDIDNLQSEFQSKSIEIEQLKDGLHSKDLKIEDLTSSLNNFHNQLRANECEIGFLKDEIKELNTTNRTLQDRFMSCFSECNEVNEKLRESHNVIDQLKSTISDRDKNFYELTSEMQILSHERKDLLSKISLQDEKIKHHDLSGKKLQEELQSKSLEVENKTRSINDLNNQIKASDDEIKSLTNHLKKMKAKNDVIETNLNKYLIENKELKEQLSNFLKSVTKLDNSIVEKEHQICQMKTLIQNLSEEKKECQLTTARQEGEIKQLEISKKDLESKLQSKSSEASTLLQERDDLSTKLLTSKEELSIALSKVQDLDEQLSETNRRFSCVIVEKESLVTKLQEDIKKLEQDNEEKNVKLEDQEGEIKQLEISKKDLESKLQSKSSEASTLLQERDDLSTKLLTSKEELSIALSKVQDLDEQLSETNRQFSCVIVEKESLVIKMQEDIKKLEQDNEEKNTKLKDQEGEIKQLEISKKDLESKLQSKSSEASTLLQERDDLSTKLLTSKEELSIALSKVQDLDEQLSETNRRFSCVIVEKESLVTKLQEDIKKLEQDNEEKNAKLEDQSENIIELSKIKEDIERQLQIECLAAEELSNISSGLQNQISDLTAKNIKLTEELAEAQVNLNNISADLKQKVNDLSEKNIMLERELVKSQENVSKISSDFQQQINDILSKNIALEEKTSDLQQQVEDQSVKKESLEKELVEARQELTIVSSDLKQQISILSSENATLHVEIENKHSALSELQNALQTLKDKKNEVERELQNQVDSLNAKVISLEDAIESKEAELVHLSEKLEYANSVLLSQSDYSVLKDENKELSSQLSSVTAGAAHLENIIQEDNFKIDLQDRTIKKLEAAVQEKDEVIKNLQQHNTSLKEICEETKRLVSVKETDLKNFQVELKSKCEELEKANELLKGIEGDYKKGLESVRSLCEEKNMLENHLEENLKNILLIEQKLLVEKEKVESMSIELSKQREKLLETNEEHTKIIEENKTLKRQVENQDPQLKEAYDKLFDDYHRLNGEHDDLRGQLSQVHSALRAEYDEKLKKLKAEMKASCTQILEVKEKKHAKELKGLQEMVKDNQNHISQLSTNLWDTSDKLLSTKNENEELKKMVIDLKKKLSLNQSAPDGLQRTRSQDQLGDKITKQHETNDSRSSYCAVM